MRYNSNMLDIKFIRDNTDLVKKGVTTKGYDASVVDEVLKLDLKRRELIKEIEDNDKKTTLQKFDYTTGAKAILIDKTGKSFYNRTVKVNRDLKKYDVYRSYKKNNVKNIKELYLDVSKLKSRLGFKDFNEKGPELNENEI